MSSSIQGNQYFTGVKDVILANTVNQVNYDYTYNIVNENGLNNELGNVISIGLNAGSQDQGPNSIAIGTNAGEFFQAPESISIGTSAGFLSQGYYAVSIGSQNSYYTGTYQSNQSFGAVSIGAGAGAINQGTYAVSVGFFSGQIDQGFGAVSIGAGAGEFVQGTGAVALGFLSAPFEQGNGAISIGSFGGFITYGNGQNYHAISVGNYEYINQETGSIAIGSSNEQLQATGAICIGYNAHNTYGVITQGYSAISIGSSFGSFVQAEYSTIINSSGESFSTSNSGLYVDPIRIYSNPAITNPLVWDSSSNEVFVNTNKTFVIDHPIDENKLLVHACVESPSSNLFYNGVGKIAEESSSVDIQLPAYVEKIGKDFTVSLTSKGRNGNLYTNGVVEGKYFTVFGDSGSEFFWHVYGLMGSIVAEPNKKDVDVKGNGPYRWI